MDPFKLLKFYKRIFGKILGLIFNPTFINFHLIPKDGPALIICNHESYLDAVLIEMGVDRPVSFIAYKELFQRPWIRHFLDVTHSIPISSNKFDVIRALNEVDSLFSKGNLVCIFPEGRLSIDGELSDFRSGIESILKRTQVPVIVMALTGLWDSPFSRKLTHPIEKFKYFFNKSIKIRCDRVIIKQDCLKYTKDDYRKMVADIKKDL